MGVKLDIYAWMESFINITYRMNVSTVDVYRHEVFKHSSVSMFDCVSLCLKCKDEICGCKKGDPVRVAIIVVFFFSNKFFWGV